MYINPAILTCGLCGLIYLLSGWILLHYPPKKINDFYGYRTSRSKISQEHWDFAQKESAKHIKQAGYYCLLFCAPFILLDYKIAHLWVAIIFATLIPFVSIFQTEKALKSKFGS